VSVTGVAAALGPVTVPHVDVALVELRGEHPATVGVEKVPEPLLQLAHGHDVPVELQHIC
jgi:hypothetical protein